jgi:hypothetical protein
MRKTYFSLAILSVAFLTGCVGVRGSGNVISEPRTVSGFDSIALSGDGQLIIEQGDSDSLTVTADDNLLPYLTSDVSGKELRLSTRNGTSVNPSRRVVYHVSLKKLQDIALSGSGSVDASHVNTDRLKISVSGSADIRTSGNAGQQDISISGSADYHGEDLKTKIASIEISGAAKAVVAVSDKLDASVSGAGSIEYVGDPVVTQQVSGAGSIHKR